MEVRECHRIAALLTTGKEDADPLDLERNFFLFLTSADDMCARAGASMLSRQAIVCLILTWMLTHPQLPIHLAGDSRG